MFGAITGDIIGSIYERNNIKTKEFPLFKNECFFTDDSVMTVAVANAIMQGASSQDFVESMSYYGKKYPLVGYGKQFKQWLNSNNKKPYNSYGNGSAMRVSPCAWCVPLIDMENGIKKVEKLAETSATVSHNHSEGVKGALAIAHAIYFMRHARKLNKVESYKKLLKENIQKRFSYNLSRKIDEIRPTYSFNSSSQRTVPEAIIAFLESNSFVDSIRNAISIGGDSDTLAAMTASIAEAAYGMPKEIIDKSLSFLDDDLKNTIYAFRHTYHLNNLR